MPLPLILGIGAAIAGVTGIGSGIHGAKKMKDASDTMKEAKNRHESNIERFNNKNAYVTKTMDKLGSYELNILKSFVDFSDLIEEIQNRPEFTEVELNGIKLPKYDKEELKKVSVGAGVLLGGIGGAAAGTAGGFAAAGATTAAVMALGTASTGTAIASLSGVAATNATLAALGGGALAAGGGGMALGSAILGGATLGVGLLVGGIIFNFTGNKIGSKADSAYSEMKRAEEQINKICNYLSELEFQANKFYEALSAIYDKYQEYYSYVRYTVRLVGKHDWNDFSEAEKKATQTMVLLVGLLYKMCQVKLVLLNTNENQLNKVNYAEIDTAIADSKAALVTLKNFV